MSKKTQSVLMRCDHNFVDLNLECKSTQGCIIAVDEQNDTSQIWCNLAVVGGRINAAIRGVITKNNVAMSSR